MAEIIKKIKNKATKIAEFLKDDASLYRDENPELFDYVKLYLVGHVSFDANVIKPKHLKYISEIDIKDNIKTLKGIEKLPNLTNLTINGYSELNLTIEMLESLRQCYFLYEDEEEYNKKSQLIKADFNQKRNMHQLQDFSVIGECKSLKVISLKNQRNLTELDLSNLKNLEHLNLSGCINLKTVKGIVKETESKLSKKLIFTDCFSLVDIIDIELLCKKIYEANNCDYLITFPTTTFCHLKNKYPTVIENLVKNIKEQNKDPFKWIEPISHINYVDINTRQVDMLSQKASEVISQLNDKSMSDIQKISNVYRWICDNYYYDHFNLAKERSGIRSDIISAMIRSSYQTYMRGCGVCVGISNYFNFMLAEMGYMARPCYGHLKKSVNEHETDIFIDHQMSRIELYDKSNKKYTYYCDPTTDLGKKRSERFLCTKDEFTYNIDLTFADENVEEAPSLIYELLYDNLLMSKYQGAKELVSIRAEKARENEQKKIEFLKDK